MPKPTTQLPSANGGDPILRADIDNAIDNRLNENRASLRQDDPSAKLVITALGIEETADTIRLMRNCIRKRLALVDQPAGVPPAKKRKIAEQDAAVEAADNAADIAVNEVGELRKLLEDTQAMLSRAIEVSARSGTNDAAADENLQKAAEAAELTKALQANVDQANKHAEELEKIRSELEEARTGKRIATSSQLCS